MSIQQRLTKLEQVTSQPQDLREPLLVTITNTDLNTGKIIEVEGILYDYGNEPRERHFNTQELKEYKLSGAMA